MNSTSTTKRPRNVDSDISGALAALRRAHERAFRFGQTIVIYEDGEIREIAPQVTSKLKTIDTFTLLRASTAQLLAAARS